MWICINITAHVNLQQKALMKRFAQLSAEHLRWSGSSWTFSEELKMFPMDTWSCCSSETSWWIHSRVHWEVRVWNWNVQQSNFNCIEARITEQFFSSAVMPEEPFYFPEEPFRKTFFKKKQIFNEPPKVLWRTLVLQGAILVQMDQHSLLCWTVVVQMELSWKPKLSIFHAPALSDAHELW